ncbi:sulfurtransferase TusA family protein [Pyrobaculum sp.]|uniref:sulfurtransferase TusA family protein n=1 Tax=Pyrobaculum sp. TaxID=2004705 RepID=UPI003D102AB5
MPGTCRVEEGYRRRAGGGYLEVITNDPCAKEDIPVWCKFTKNELVEYVELEGDG